MSCVKVRLQRRCGFVHHQATRREGWRVIHRDFDVHCPEDSQDSPRIHERNEGTQDFLLGQGQQRSMVPHGRPRPRCYARGRLRGCQYGCRLHRAQPRWSDVHVQHASCVRVRRRHRGYPHRRSSQQPLKVLLINHKCYGKRVGTNNVYSLFYGLSCPLKARKKAINLHCHNRKG